MKIAIVKYRFKFQKKLLACLNKHHGAVEVCFICFRLYYKVSGQPQASVSLPRRKSPPVLYGEEADYAPEPTVALEMEVACSPETLVRSQRVPTQKATIDSFISVRASTPKQKFCMVENRVAKKDILPKT